LKPEISMKEFAKIFNSVGPNEYVKVERVQYKPTHRKKDDPNRTLMVTRNAPGVVYHIMDFGSTGSTSSAMFDAEWDPIV